MTTVSEATQLIEEHIERWPVEEVPLEHVAGRVLARDVAAERDIPAFDRVTMDGIAIAHRAWVGGRREFEILATQAAGQPAVEISVESQCVRVMTGAVLPQGTDSVIPVERLEIEGERAAITAEQVEAGQFVHPRGSDRSQGSVVLRAGTVAGAPELAVLASVGQASVAVTRLPRIAVVSTGDELVGVDEPVAAHQIRSSNGRAIEGAVSLHHCGSVTRRRMRDEPEGLLAELQALHDSHDVMILSGGVSMGAFDFVPDALQHLGASVVFHRIDQKPGRPMWFGISRERKPIFALPGNPVSTLVCMARHVIPALRSALGFPSAPEQAILGETMRGGPNRFTWFVPVQLRTDPDGRLLATPRHINTSGDFSSLAATDGIAELGLSDEERSKGAVTRVYRW